MPTTITLDDDAAAALQALRTQAAARGIDFDQYLRYLAVQGELIPQSTLRSPHQMTQAEFAHWLSSLSHGIPPLPSLPDDFSRADLYHDHD